MSEFFESEWRAEVLRWIKSSEEKDAENERLTALLRKARQYVSDAGCDEDHETQTHSCALLDEIDAALEPKP